MDNVRQQQEDKLISIVFQQGKIPSEIKSNFQSIFIEKKSKSIVKAITQIHNNGVFNYKNIGLYIAEKSASQKWIAEIDRLHDLMVPETELIEILNLLKEGLLVSQIKEIHKNMEEQILESGDVSYIEETKKQLNNLISIENNQQNFTMDEVLNFTMAKIQEGMEKESEITGISTGLKTVDDNTGGLNDTDLIVIAARPGQGKTSFVINLINATINSKYHVPSLFFSAEMPSFQLGMRLLALQAQVDAQKMRTPKRITETEMKRILEKRELIKNAPVITNDTASISFQELAEIARRKKDEEDIKVIYVDYLQRLKFAGFGSEKMPRHERIEEGSRLLKELAKELGIPVVALAQLKRTVDTSGTPPSLSDLKDSGGIEQEADLIGFIHRDFSIIDDINQPHDINLIIAKNRHGPLGFLELGWIPKYTEVTEKEKMATETNETNAFI